MPSTNRFALLLIGIGILLIASPAAVYSVEIGEPTTEFEAIELSYENGSFEVPPQVATTFYIENIACIGASRSCDLERYVYEQGQWPIEERGQDGYEFLRGYYEFAYLNGTFYRTETINKGKTTYIAHEQVSPDDAIRGSSTTYGIAAPAYRRAVDEGRATTTKRLDTRQIITTNPGQADERYYYVYATSTPSAGEHGPELEDRLLRYGLSGIGFLVGLALILRGQRIRLRSQWGD